MSDHVVANYWGISRLHVLRQQSGRPLTLCGRMPPLFESLPPEVVSPTDPRLCKRCLRAAEKQGEGQ